MYLYSIPNLHKAVQSTGLYNSKRPSEKQVLIDKCNWFIHSIVEGNKQHWDLFNYKPVPLSKEILKDVIGRTEYLNVKDLLEELGYITVDNKYSSASFIKLYNDSRVSNGKKALELQPTSKKYALTDKAITTGILKVGIITSRMRTKIRKYKDEKINQYINDPVHNKILNSITKIKFNPHHTKALNNLKNSQGITDKDKYHREAYTELQELNSLNSIAEYAQSDSFYYTQSKNVNRVFHYYSTVPKAYRESLQLKSGGNLSEIDLRNSQPLIIALNYLKINGKNDGSNLLKDVLSGGFYKAVADKAHANNDIDTYNLFADDYSKFKAQVLGQGLYFNYIPDLNKIKPMEAYLMELYPNFMRYIRNKKRTNGYKIISIEAQLVESSIFINGLYNRLKINDIAIPVHDSIVIPTDKEQYFLGKLVESFKSVFPYLPENNIKALFRITEY